MELFFFKKRNLFTLLLVWTAVFGKVSRLLLTRKIPRGGEEVGWVGLGGKFWEMPLDPETPLPLEVSRSLLESCVKGMADLPHQRNSK